MTSFSQGYALLICVDDNTVTDLKLPAVKRDLDALRDVLTSADYCCYPVENIKCISGTDATRANMLGGLGWLSDKLAADTTGNATAVVFFSGHGHRDARGYYMIPYDIDLQSLRVTALNASDFAAAISAVNPMRLLVLLDCCQSGGVAEMTKSVDLARINSAAAPVELFLDDPGFGGQAKDIDTSAFPDALAEGRGRAIISSSQGEEKSWVLKSGRMSVFTYHVVQALIGHAPTTTTAAGALTVAVLDLAKYLDENVNATVMSEHSPATQRPYFKTAGMSFPIALVHAGVGYAKGITVPDAVDVADRIARNTVALNSTDVVQVSGDNNVVNKNVTNIGQQTTLNINMGGLSPAVLAALASMQHSVIGGQPVQQADRLTLRDELAAGFSLDEIKALCFELGLDYEDIAGTTRSAKIIELILYCERHRTLPQLAAAIHRARPGV